MIGLWTVPMIRCIPKGLCSWNFDIAGSGHFASTQLNWLGEQGSMTIDGEHYDIRKDSLFRGHWTLDANSTTIASGQKSTAFTRTFELETAAGVVVLRAHSAFGRTMLLEGAGFDGVIAPAHMFTRRATISGQVPDFRTACFAFWLTALLWRRTAKNNAS